ncbi:MAG TPA: hypothetical protein VEU07_07255, partial [Candidatus Acidoferrum sp.]|nr:hypothetical protein [Candidatus Acidoferrum sp.]
MTPTITVRGIVTDAGPVAVRIDGRPVPVDGVAFAADVPLRHGLNRLEVEATDAAGNHTRLIRTVRFEDLHRIQALVPPVLVAAGLPDLGGVAFGPDGALVVTVPHAGRIYRIPGEGGAPQLRQDHLRQPVGIAVMDDGTLFVAEQGADRILRIDPDGTRRVVLDQLDDPRGLALDSHGHLFLTAGRWPRAGRDADGDIHRGVVLRLDLASGKLQVVTDSLVAPAGIVVATDGSEERLWVVAERRHGEAEARGEALFRITLAGAVGPIPGPHLWRPQAVVRDGLGSLWLTARRQYSTPEDMDDDADDWERGVLFKLTGEGVWQRFAAHLDAATGMALAGQGDLFVVET